MVKISRLEEPFKNVEKMFYKMYLHVKNDEINEDKKEKFKEICQQSLEKLERYKQEILFQ